MQTRSRRWARRSEVQRRDEGRGEREASAPPEGAAIFRYHCVRPDAAADA